MNSIASLGVPLMTCVLLGFCCLVAWRVAEYVKALPGQRRPIVRPQPKAAAPDLPQPVKRAICPQCGTMLPEDPSKPCEFCEYKRPTDIRRGRESFAAIKRRVENQNPIVRTNV